MTTTNTCITKIEKLQYLNTYSTVARKVDQWHILLDKGTREEYIIQMRSSYTTHHPNETSNAKTLSYTTQLQHAVSLAPINIIIQLLHFICNDVVWVLIGITGVALVQISITFKFIKVLVILLPDWYIPMLPVPLLCSPLHPPEICPTLGVGGPQKGFRQTTWRTWMTWDTQYLNTLMKESTHHGPMILAGAIDSCM